MATIIVPQKLYNIAKLNRNAACRLKNGSPKFKDVLRARCRAKMKENREKIVNKLRNLCSDTVANEVFSTLGIFEDYEICHSMSTETDDGEIITKEEEQIIAEYEGLLASEEEMFSEMLQKSLEDEVVCPICQKTAMVMEDQVPYKPHIVCQKCCFKIPAHTSLQNIGKHIQLCINSHSNACTNKPQFHILPEDDEVHVYMACSRCLYLSIML